MDNLRISKLLIPGLVAALAFAPVALAADSQSLALEPAADGDLVAGELMQLLGKAMARPGLSRDAVTFTHPVTAQEIVAPAPFRAASREYFVDVSAADLRAGATIHVTAPNAVVRINPVPGLAKAKAQPVDAAGLVLRSPAGTFEAGTGLSKLAGAEQMRASGAPFAEGTVAFFVAPEVGVGAIEVQAPGLKAAHGYQIHVFDRESPWALEVAAAGSDFLHGQTLRAEAKLAGADGALAFDRVEAYVTSPAGRAWPVSFEALQSGAYLADLPLDAVERATEGLWELHVAAAGRAGDLEVVRSARTAFGVHVPTAGFAGDAEMLRSGQGLDVSFAVRVGTPGRYEVRGVLYGTAADGSERPVAMGYAADWLGRDGSLALQFGQQLLDEAGVGAPYTVRHLQLLDQGRMGVLHRQAVGLVIE